MKMKPLLSTLIIASAPYFAHAAQFTLTDAATNTDVGHWKITNSELGIDTPFSIEKIQLHGGKQAGVETLVINNGELEITLIPTRGMGIFNVKRHGKRILTWDSLIKELENY